MLSHEGVFFIVSLLWDVALHTVVQDKTNILTAVVELVGKLLFPIYEHAISFQIKQMGKK